MSQQLNDLTIETWVAANTTVHRMQQDLLSLRAAVRRVLDAEIACIEAGQCRVLRGFDEVRAWSKEWRLAAMDALRAEMATIDNDNSKVQKP